MNTSVKVFHWKFQLNQIDKNRLMAVSKQRVSGDIPESAYEHFSEVRWTSMNFLSIHNLVFWDSQKFTMNTSVNFMFIHNLVFFRFTKVQLWTLFDVHQHWLLLANFVDLHLYLKRHLWTLQWSLMNFSELCVHP